MTLPDDLTLMNTSRITSDQYSNSAYVLDGSTDSDPQDTLTDENIPGEELTEDAETPNEEDTEHPDELNFDLSQLPDELTSEIKNHIQLFSNSGVEVLGLGKIEIKEDAEFEDPEEADGDVGLDLSEINEVEMYCQASDIRFIYAFYPQTEYNGLSVQYSVLKELILVSNVEALTSLNDAERANAINNIEDILSPKDLGVILRYNRTVDKSDLLSDLNIIRSQNSEVIQMVERTKDGEVAGVNIERRVYVDSDNEESHQERTVFDSVQSMSNITRSYIGVLEAAYLNNGINVPDSIAEKINSSVTDQEWDDFNKDELDDQRAPMFQ